MLFNTAFCTMQQYYPSVGELFKIFKAKSSHQMKGSNDKLSQSQCEYNLSSGEFSFQNAIFSSWALSNYMDEISWICIFQTKKMPLFPLVKNILGVLLNWVVTIPTMNFCDISHRCHYYGRRFCIYVLHKCLMVTVLLGKKSMKMRP